jgi:ankyrin repeat protein
LKVPTVQVNVQNKLGDTPLHGAAWKGNADVTTLLLEQGKYLSFAYSSSQCVSAFFLRLPLLFSSFSSPFSLSSLLLLLLLLLLLFFFAPLTSLTPSTFTGADRTIHNQSNELPMNLAKDPETARLLIVRHTTKAEEEDYAASDDEGGDED